MIEQSESQEIIRLLGILVKETIKANKMAEEMMKAFRGFPS